jgi:uncharacterized membrane protein
MSAFDFDIIDGHRADLIGLLLYLAITLGYYLVFSIEMRAGSQSLLQGRMVWYRHRWIRLIFESGDGMLAVHTFRNQLMSCTFLASTAILVDLGLLTLLGLPRESVSFLYGDMSDKAAYNWLLVKVVMMIGLYSYNFLSFAICIRDLNYLSYLSGLYGMEDSEDQERVLHHLEDLLDRVAMNYTRGLRGYFFGLPLFFWLLSPYLLIITSIVILVLLYMRDHSYGWLPKHESE